MSRLHRCPAHSTPGASFLSTALSASADAWATLQKWLRVATVSSKSIKPEGVVG